MHLGDKILKQLSLERTYSEADLLEAIYAASDIKEPSYWDVLVGKARIIAGQCGVGVSLSPIIEDQLSYTFVRGRSLCFRREEDKRFALEVRISEFPLFVGEQ